MIQIDYYITIFILMTGGTDDVFEQVVIKIEIITARRKKGFVRESVLYT